MNIELHNSYKKSSFSPAFLFLEKNQREALAIYYSFCRLMDDLVDEPDISNREEQLLFWQAEIERVYENRAITQLGKDLQKIVFKFGVSSDRFLWLIEGMLADVRGRHYSVRADFEWYLWRVAGVVGLATLDILGMKGSSADELAQALGFAVQVTNVIRDVYEDAKIGRVYLPDDLLRKFDLTREDVLHNAHHERMERLLEFLAQACKQDYEHAYKIMDTFPPRQIFPCRVMALVYRANLAKIEKTKFKFKKSVRLSKLEKAKYIIYALYKNYTLD